MIIIIVKPTRNISLKVSFLNVSSERLWLVLKWEKKYCCRPNRNSVYFIWTLLCHFGSAQVSTSFKSRTAGSRCCLRTDSCVGTFSLCVSVLEKHLLLHAAPTDNGTVVEVPSPVYHCLSRETERHVCKQGRVLTVGCNKGALDSGGQARCTLDMLRNCICCHFCERVSQQDDGAHPATMERRLLLSQPETKPPLRLSCLFPTTPPSSE